MTRGIPSSNGLPGAGRGPAAGRHRAWTPTAAALALTLLAACSSPVDRYHTLVPASAMAASSARPTAQVLTVGPVSIPDALDREGWVVRTGDTTVHIYQHQLWTQGLGAEITQALADQLNRALAAAAEPEVRAIWADGSPTNPAIDPTIVLPDALRVRVQVLRFDSLLAPAPSISDALRWTLECTGAANPAEPSLLRFHVLRSALREVTAPAEASSPGAGEDDMARRFDRLALAHAQALRVVADDIAGALAATASERAQACPPR
jgi:hypothetical protein